MTTRTAREYASALLGEELSHHAWKHYYEPDADGKRKLPFFERGGGKHPTLYITRKAIGTYFEVG